MAGVGANCERVPIVVNGRPREIAAGTTIAGLLAELRVPTRGIAVELGGEILPPARFETTVLDHGQRVEILRLVGGG